MRRVEPLIARARVAVADPGRLIPAVASHLVGHGALPIEKDGETVLEYEFCRGALRAEQGGLLLRAEAPDHGFLQEVKSDLAEHVEEFAGLPAGAIVWDGPADEPAGPPNFRVMTVSAAANVTPHMRRIRLTGDALTRFSSRRNLHCKLLIPPAGHEPEWPRMDAHGRFAWPDGPGRPIVRKYTIRAIDVEAGWLDIDFVIHDDAGPGSAWAAAARPGDVIGMVGPGGRSVPEADRYLLAGDETALPAMARLLETLPESARGLALIEVADAGEEQAVDNRTAIAIKWLHRNGAAPGTTTLLQDAVAALPPPDAQDRLFAWVSCEFAAFRALRTQLRSRWNMPRDMHLVTSYWRRGMSEDRVERLEAVRGAMAGVGRRLGLAEI